MKTAKFLTTSAVASALLPFAALAAIDDQGMQYVTAAEGLHGSLRVNILKNEDKESTDETFGGAKESLRLWITGSGDIGNGWSTTYYWEVRDGSGEPGTKKDGTIGTEAWDIGLKGPIGSVNFGKLGMVAPRMVPGGSLDTVAGGNAEHFASDPSSNGVRFESVVWNGFQVGASGIINGNDILIDSEDDLFDEYSVAVKYSSPLGLQVGIGYEVDLLHAERYDDALFPRIVADYDDRTGWRAGVRYGQANWLLAYEYRSYEGFPGWSGGNLFDDDIEWVDASGAALLATSNTTVPANTNIRPVGSSNAVPITKGTVTIEPDANFNRRVGYQVHRLGVQVKFDRITASAGYSLEAQSLDVPGATDINRNAFAVDAAYHLGLNSLLAVGWKKVATEQWGGVTVLSSNNSGYGNAVNVSATRDAGKATTTSLYYRVDF